MQEWEYGQLTAYVRGRFFGLGVKAEINWNGRELSRDVPLIEHLNHRGLEGWELVSSYATIGPGAPELIVAYVFKRPVSKPGPRTEEERDRWREAERLQALRKDFKMSAPS